MVDVASTVGAQSVPLEAGSLADATTDPTIELLLAYCRHWLRYALNDRLAVQTPTAADAVPEDRVFAWDPQGTWMRTEIAAPSLYIWQEGKSAWSPTSSMVRSFLNRTLWLLWVFDEVQLPNGFAARRGLINAADAALHRAFYEMYHPTFAYGTHVAGRSLRALLTGDPADFNAEYLGGEAGFLSPIPGGSGRVGDSADGRIQRGFIALRGSIGVIERVGTATLETSDELADTQLLIRANAEDKDPASLMDFMERSIT